MPSIDTASRSTVLARAASCTSTSSHSSPPLAAPDSPLSPCGGAHPSAPKIPPWTFSTLKRRWMPPVSS